MSHADAQEHNRLITEQFTRQAVPFSQLHSDDESVQLLIKAAQTTSQDTVLDVACGPGLLACGFAAIAAHVTGVDLTPAMIDQARQLQQTKSLTNLTWRFADASALPFPNASFSIVVTRYALHHLLDPARALSEMIRVCRPGGTIVVADVFTTSPEQARAYDAMEKLRDPSHARALGLQELQDLFTTAGIDQLQTQFYRFDVEVDHLLHATRTPPEAAAKLRNIISADIGKNLLGINAHRSEKSLHFSFPIVILVGRKQP
jgi:ubiquinone/menaquinone biosynthesis C-methylase UbiE